MWEGQGEVKEGGTRRGEGSRDRGVGGKEREME